MEFLFFFLLVGGWGGYQIPDPFVHTAAYSSSGWQPWRGCRSRAIFNPAMPHAYLYVAQNQKQ